MVLMLCFSWQPSHDDTPRSCLSSSLESPDEDIWIPFLHRWEQTRCPMLRADTFTSCEYDLTQMGLFPSRKEVPPRSPPYVERARTLCCSRDMFASMLLRACLVHTAVPASILCLPLNLNLRPSLILGP